MGGLWGRMSRGQRTGLLPVALSSRKWGRDGDCAVEKDWQKQQPLGDPLQKPSNKGRSMASSSGHVVP